MFCIVTGWPSTHTAVSSCVGTESVGGMIGVAKACHIYTHKNTNKNSAHTLAQREREREREPKIIPFNALHLPFAHCRIVINCMCCCRYSQFKMSLLLLLFLLSYINIVYVSVMVWSGRDHATADKNTHTHTVQAEKLLYKQMDRQETKPNLPPP